VYLTPNPAGRGAAYQACALIIGLAPAALTLIFHHGLPLRNLAVPAAVAGGFALFAWLLRGVTASGALAGSGVAFTLYARQGWRMFAALLLVFLLTWGATRAGDARKRARGVAERGTGRDAAQVVANVGLAAWALVTPVSAVVAATAALAVLAEAAADTCSSELGKAFGGKTFLITNFAEVAPGTNGGVSLLGVGVALLAAKAPATLAGALRLLSPLDAALAALVAFAASFLDSLLGATLERRGLLNNDAVNFFSTAAAGGLAGLLCHVL
jgi:uncharacterized protein (TIGR00297 family)